MSGLSDWLTGVAETVDGITRIVSTVTPSPRQLDNPTPDQHAKVPAKSPSEKAQSQSVDWDAFVEESLRDAKKNGAPVGTRSAMPLAKGAVQTKPGHSLWGLISGVFRLTALFVAVGGLMLFGGLVATVWSRASQPTVSAVVAPLPSVAPRSVVSTSVTPAAHVKSKPQIQPPVVVVEAMNVPEVQQPESTLTDISQPAIPEAEEEPVLPSAEEFAPVIPIPKTQPYPPMPPRPRTPRNTAPTRQVLPPSTGRVWVDGYTRKDGTKVRGYWRSK